MRDNFTHTDSDKFISDIKSAAKSVAENGISNAIDFTENNIIPAMETAKPIVEKSLKSAAEKLKALHQRLKKE